MTPHQVPDLTAWESVARQAFWKGVFCGVVVAALAMQVIS